MEISIQSHKDIVESFISMMDSAISKVNEYKSNDEEPVTYSMSYFEIVQTLLLQGTNHAGGASTRAKCAELGYDYAETVTFGEDEINTGGVL